MGTPERRYLPYEGKTIGVFDKFLGAQICGLVDKVSPSALEIIPLLMALKTRVVRRTGQQFFDGDYTRIRGLIVEGEKLTLEEQISLSKILGEILVLQSFLKENVTNETHRVLVSDLRVNLDAFREFKEAQEAAELEDLDFTSMQRVLAEMSAEVKAKASAEFSDEALVERVEGEN